MGNLNSSNEESFHSHYVLGKQLGKGAQGRVHVCHHKVSGAFFAVKMIDRSVKTSWATYRREVDLCKSACSNNVVRVLADFVDADYCYIVMERYEGHLRKGLKWVSKEGPQPGVLGDEPLRRIMGQVLCGIQHLHNCGIAHRDVKSHNVFIDRVDVRHPGCRVVLGDLGLARRLEHGRFLCAQVGTRKYWGPELYDKKYTHNADIFALGVLFFLVVCSQYPYFDEHQARHRDVFAEGLVPASLSPQALSFLKLSLQKDPSQRPSSNELALHPWLLGDAREEGRAAEAPAAPEVSEKPEAAPEGGGAGQEDAQKPLPPQVCHHWRSRQVVKVLGDADDQIGEDSTGPERYPCRDESDEETPTPSVRRPRRPACGDGDRTPPTPATTASSATASPSAKSAGSEGERHAEQPEQEQETVEEMHSSESAAARFWDRAADPPGSAPRDRSGAAEQDRFRVGKPEPDMIASL